ncbi:helix-turn-helix domain-containing protein [Planomonospora sp. ID91781]|uniref:helix-turn-helix domain-containing protein n=1 Tax=Planomonospora sp. ID91781 TaxID=2738135 RepID=UPI0018C3932C|nr:helix-turn-helix domain-containing protein [Planomonospora sp. ID91781]MBG0823267.1 helix-turn-helix domain-containing protein [Planomonospora sp. ID91781]
MTDQVPAALQALGARLRRVRRAGDLTMEQVAERTGISQPTLSRLESESRQPSLAQLLTLADVYGVTVGELLGEAPGRATAVIDPAECVERVGNGLRFRVVDRGDPGAGLSAIQVTVPARRGGSQMQQHPGDEWLYVLHGRLRLTLAGSTQVLRPGMVAHFDATTPHRLDAADRRDVELLLVAARPATQVLTPCLREAT